jgi:hypothetical protein
MIRYCLEKWDRNNSRLIEAIKADKTLNHCTYYHLVELLVTHVLNDDRRDTEIERITWNTKKITEVNDGEYQGTLLYLIPALTYQPGADDYLMTHAYYGSCSACDTLQGILDGDKQNIQKDLFNLCRELLSNIIRPYNFGWRKNDVFEFVEMEPV